MRVKNNKNHCSPSLFFFFFLNTQQFACRRINLWAKCAFDVPAVVDCALITAVVWSVERGKGGGVG